MNDEKLYSINKDAKCLKCGNKGVVQLYGWYYPSGLGNRVDEFGKIMKPIMEKYRDEPYMDHAMGFGGTIPHECMNCGNIGLIDMGGLEGYEMAFETIKEL